MEQFVVNRREEIKIKDGCILMILKIECIMALLLAIVWIAQHIIW